MNLNSKGWLEKYISFRSEWTPVEDSQIAIPDKKLYQLVQPTGMLYGHPIQLPYHDQPLVNQLVIHDKMKVIMAEGMLHSFLDQQGLSNSDRKEILHGSVIHISEFYENLYPRMVFRQSWFSKKTRDPVQKAEQLLVKRINIRGSLTSNFWKSFFHNSLLFLDLYYFGQWTPGDLSGLEDIAKKKVAMRMFVLKVIACAAHADKILEKEEENLFGYFLKSAHFSKALEKEAWEYIKSGISLEEIEIPDDADSWLLKKYVLEMAILTIWADKLVKEEEKEFLERLCSRLGFSDLELESSMLCLETFVLENWQSVHYLRNQREISMVSEVVIKRMRFFVNMNKDRVVQEINESKELMRLLAKSRKEELTPEEKIIVRTQLIDILKLIPAFLIIALPFTFITLPILLKILPKSAFPTSFQD